MDFFSVRLLSAFGRGQCFSVGVGVSLLGAGSRERLAVLGFISIIKFKRKFLSELSDWLISL